LTINKETTLTAGAAVKYRGYTVGEVTDVELMRDLSGVMAKVHIKPQYFQHFNRSDTVYWLVQPQLGLRGIKNVATTVFGDYLSVDKGIGTTQSEFVVNQSNLGYNKGVAITLYTEQLRSLKVGAPVLYRQMRVGQINQIQLSEDSRNIAVRITVYQQYRHLITRNSRFWNASGFKVDMGLFSGIQVDSQTFESIVAGGIALAAALEGEPVNQGHTFVLHPKPQPDWLDGLVEDTETEN
jgi:paraquat-inducible protein B